MAQTATTNNKPSPAKIQETPEKEPKLYQKTKDAIAMVNAGIEPREALKYANLKDNISAKQVSVFRSKVKKHSIVSPQIVKLAHNQIKRILAGEVREVPQQVVTKAGQVIDYIETITPSDTNIIAAATLSYDRYEPVVRQNINLNIDVHPVDLSAYSNRKVEGTQDSSQIIDVESVVNSTQDT